MAVTTKNYLDLAGLQAYDGLIKAWANSADQLGYKTVLKSEDGNSLLFYKKANAVQGTDTADETISLGNSDMQAQLNALAAKAGAVWDSENSVYTLALDATFDSNTDTILKALNELKRQINTLNGADTVVGSVAKAIKDKVETLDTTSDVGIASVSNNVVTIKGSIAESDGIIEAGSAADIVLEEVAYTGAAADVSTAVITDGDESDPQQLYAAGTAQSTLEAIARDLNSLESSSVVTVEQQATAETGYISTYVVKQNGEQVGAKINIPKDYLVKSADVDTVTAADKAAGGKFENDSDFAIGDKYIDFTINTVEGSGNESHLYINVNDLMDALSVEANADEVQLAISATNEISADIVKVSAAKIAYSNTTSGSAVEETVQAALTRIDGDNTTAGSIKKAVKDAVEALDTPTNVTLAAVSGTAITLTGALSETDGIVAGESADNVVIDSIATSDISAMFT